MKAGRRKKKIHLETWKSPPFLVGFNWQSLTIELAKIEIIDQELPTSWGLPLIYISWGYMYTHSSQKDYIQTFFLFSEFLSRKKKQLSVPQEYYPGINLPKLALRVFVYDSEKCIETMFGNCFLGRYHFSYTKNVFGIVCNAFWLEYNRFPEYPVK